MLNGGLKACPSCFLLVLNIFPFSHESFSLENVEKLFFSAWGSGDEGQGVEIKFLKMATFSHFPKLTFAAFISFDKMKFPRLSIQFPLGK